MRTAGESRSVRARSASVRGDAPVSFLFFPRRMMVSPRKRERVSIVVGLIEATELSSEADSSTTSRFGLRSVRGVSAVQRIADRDD